MMDAFLLVGDGEASALALAAARRAFPSSTPLVYSDVAAARVAVPSASTANLLVLIEPDAAAHEAALRAIDANGAPLWAVVVLAASPPPAAAADAVPPEEWEPRLLARVFRATLALHQAACDAHRTRGDLLAIGHRIAHDLRAPINGVLVTAEVLQETLADEADGPAALIQPILDSVDELMGTINRLAVVTKATARPRPLQPVPLGDTVWAVLEQVESRVRAKDGRLEQPPEWPQVRGVAEWIELVWTELLLNALNHGGPAPRIELGWTREGDRVRCHVRDHGAGVAPAVRPHLLQPFEQLAGPESRRGLGLSLVRRLLELQGGTLGAEPPGSDGACFFFTLPSP